VAFSTDCHCIISHHLHCPIAVLCISQQVIWRLLAFQLAIVCTPVLVEDRIARGLSQIYHQVDNDWSLSPTSQLPGPAGEPNMSSSSHVKRPHNRLERVKDRSTNASVRKSTRSTEDTPICCLAGQDATSPLSTSNPHQPLPPFVTPINFSIPCRNTPSRHHHRNHHRRCCLFTAPHTSLSFFQGTRPVTQVHLEVAPTEIPRYISSLPILPADPISTPKQNPFPPFRRHFVPSAAQPRAPLRIQSLTSNAIQDVIVL